MTEAVLVTADPHGIGRKSPVQIETEVSRHLQALTDLLGTGDWLVVSDLSVHRRLRHAA